jgi:hypothetical protein
VRDDHDHGHEGHFNVEQQHGPNADDDDRYDIGDGDPHDDDVGERGGRLLRRRSRGPAQRPSRLELTGDGTLFVSGVQSSSWGGPTAQGSGNAEYHGCTPNCAQAPVHTALVSIRLFGSRVCSGRTYYSGVNLTLNSGQLLDEQFLQRSWSPC